jgi:hypothetical protein
MMTWTAPHTQQYYQRTDGRWVAALALDGAPPGEILEADTEPELRALVLERLRAWVSTAGAAALGELLDQLGKPRGALNTLTRRAACELALTEMEL